MKKITVAIAVISAFYLASSGSSAAQAASPFSIQIRGGGVQFGIGNGYHRSYYGNRGVYGRGNYAGGNYGRGNYGRGHYDWHNTSHYDFHPGSYYRHGNHFDYSPGHFDLHRTGHFDYHRGGRGRH
jgi:hypothetical protein